MADTPMSQEEWDRIQAAGAWAKRYSPDPRLADRKAQLAGGVILNGNGQRDVGDDPPPRFKVWTPAELLAQDLTFKWTVRGIWTHPTYGQLAGELKTLKSYLALFVALAVASGKPLFGLWAVDRPGHVVIYVGEGGRIPFTRRLQRCAAAMGIDLAALDTLHVSFDIAPIASQTFQRSLAEDLERWSPVLVIIDPLYAFHGTGTNASNLHEEGALLSPLSATCMAAEASLLVVNHFNQTGSGDGLKRITQAGSGEWVDSWLLTSHREPPDVDAGRFWLLLEVGSRQWGGTNWALDVELGAFDPDTGEHDGPITWHVARHRGGGSPQEAKAARAGHAILDVLEDHPFEFTMTEAIREVGGTKDVTRAEFDRLRSAAAIRSELVKREGKRQASAVWAVNHLQGHPESASGSAALPAQLTSSPELPGTTGNNS